MSWFLVPFTRSHDEDITSEVILVQCDWPDAVDVDARDRVIDELVVECHAAIWGHASQWGVEPVRDSDELWYVTGRCECGDAEACEREGHSNDMIIEVPPAFRAEEFLTEAAARQRALEGWNRTDTLFVLRRNGEASCVESS